VGLVPNPSALKFSWPATLAGSNYAHSVNEGAPFSARSRRGRSCFKGLDWIGCLRDMIQDALRGFARR
jgi:hypothetical protein